METERKILPRRLLIAAAIGVSGYLGAYFPVVLMLLPAFLGFILPAWGLAPYLTALASAVFSTLVACGLTTGALYCLATFLPAALIIGVVLKAKAPYRFAVCYSAAAIAIACYLMLCLSSILAGLDPFTQVKESLKFMLDGMAQLSQGMPDAEAMTSAFKEYGALLLIMAPELTVIMVMTMGMGFGFFDVLIARAMAKARGAQLRPMAKFWFWQLPQSFVWGLVILAAGAIFVNVMEMANAGAVTAAVECIAVAPFALIGLSFTEFNSRVIRARTAGRRALSYVLVALFLPYSILALAFVGLLERLLKVRKRYMDSQGGHS